MDEKKPDVLVVMKRMAKMLEKLTVDEQELALKYLCAKFPVTKEKLD